MNKISSLEIAVGNEKSEMEYYEREAERSSNPVVKKLFLTLAGDEKEHMTRIRELHQRLVKSGSWPEQLPVQVAGTEVAAVLESLTRVREASAGADANDLAALRKAEKFEENGIRFYEGLSKSSTDPREQSFFKFLASIEREHYLSIQDSIFYLEDPAGWFESKERGLLEG